VLALNARQIQAHGTLGCQILWRAVTETA